jgi:hypothetical protein
VPLARAAAECAVLAGDSAWMAGHRDEARAIWREGADILVGAGMDAPSHRMDRGARLLKIVRGRFSDSYGRDAKATGLHIGEERYAW